MEGVEQSAKSSAGQGLHGLIDLPLRSLFLNALARHWPAVSTDNKVRLALPGQG